MKTTELRIGSWVNENGEDFQWTSRCYEETNGPEFNPIPLTEEWLIKFGW